MSVHFFGPPPWRRPYWARLVPRTITKRVYDPYYSDYHVWNDDEVVYYQQWAHEYHRDTHRDSQAAS
ncbi:MAG: hypothetical protein WA239_17130 [Candidatus Sulfotelmatobacter sp.]